MGAIIITKTIKDVHQLDVSENHSSDPSIGAVIDTYLQAEAHDHTCVITVSVELDEKEWLTHSRYLRESNPTARAQQARTDQQVIKPSLKR